MIPHEEIRVKHDRSWSNRLVETIRDSAPHEDLSEVCTTLQQLQDPRIVQTLLQMLEDTALPLHMREAASTILQRSCIGLCEEDRRNWWASADRLLNRHAVIEARTSEAGLLLPIASDANHEFHLEAIRSLEFGFEEPEFQRLSIKALKHPDSEVREAAARNLIWEEPFEAQDALIKALSDESDEVADEALKTISYFTSQKVMKSLAELKDSGPIERREGFDSVLGAVEESFEWAFHRLGREAQAFFRIWLKPVEDLLDLEEQHDEEVVTPPKFPPDNDTRKVLHTAKDVIGYFSNIEEYWHDSYLYLFRCEWETFSDTDRIALVSFFREHEDPAIRELACQPLSLWNRGDVLEAFLKDRCGGVRKYAAFNLKSVTPDPAIAASLWAAYQNVNCTGYSASETLAAYVVHASKEGLEDLLADIALGERRISRKGAAIYELQKLEAHSHMRSLLPLLGEPPLVNWSIHCNLVDYCAGQKLSVPHFGDLCSTDDLGLQEALAGAFPYVKPVLLKGVSYAAKN